MDVLEALKVKTGETDEDMLGYYLDSARASILARRYPFGDGTEDLEDRYLDLQVRIASELYAKRGADGQTSHKDDTADRAWASAGVSPALLREVIPKAKVISG